MEQSEELQKLKARLARLVLDEVTEKISSDPDSALPQAILAAVERKTSALTEEHLKKVEWPDGDKIVARVGKSVNETLVDLLGPEAVAALREHARRRPTTRIGKAVERLRQRMFVALIVVALLAAAAGWIGARSLTVPRNAAQNDIGNNEADDLYGNGAADNVANDVPEALPEASPTPSPTPSARPSRPPPSPSPSSSRPSPPPASPSPSPSPDGPRH
ncbi:MAG: hypothetical protein WDN24_01315 [Sphingomonas sp.]